MLAQQLLEGEKYATISWEPIILFSIRNKLEAHSADASGNESSRHIARLLLADFNTRWGSGDDGTVFSEHQTLAKRNRLKGIPILAMMAAMLDPRTKKCKKWCGAADIPLVTAELRRRLLLVPVVQAPPHVAQARQAPRTARRQVDVLAQLLDDSDDGGDGDDDDDGNAPNAAQRHEQNVDAELYRYNQLPVLARIDNDTQEFNNPFEWWSRHEGQLPIMAQLARSILCIPATSAPAERLFSSAGLTIANDRASLLPENAADLIFLRNAWVVADNIAVENDIRR